MIFSQRAGIKPATKLIQRESIDEELRNTLWSILLSCYFNKFNKYKYDMMGDREDYIRKSNLGWLFNALWLGLFKKPTDTIPKYYYDDGLIYLREYYFAAKWNEVFDFIEFIINADDNHERKNNLIKFCNKALDKENSAYRFVDEKIVEISSDEEITEIEQAFSKALPFKTVKNHLSTAIEMISDRKSPDYRNSIKESISAVEALCREISGEKKATLGVALKVLEKKGMLHPALKNAFSSLYGYTNDANGIRHALMSESNLTSADARFMLISCSAFINYVIATSAD